MNKKITRIFIESVLNSFMRIENLYLKFILTVIAVVLIFLAIEQSNWNSFNAKEQFNDSTKSDIDNNSLRETYLSMDDIVNSKYMLIDETGNKYPIFITKGGAAYIIKMSDKDQEEYRYYLPIEIKETINNLSNN